MKNIGNLILAVAIFAVAGVAHSYLNGKENLKQVEFIDYRQEWRAEIDSIKAELDTIKVTTWNIKKDTELLKKGQEVIFLQTKKANEKSSFIDNINDLF